MLRPLRLAHGQGKEIVSPAQWGLQVGSGPWAQGVGGGGGKRRVSGTDAPTHHASVVVSPQRCPAPSE